MRGLRRRQPSPLLGPMRHSVLSRGPKTRRKRRSQAWTTAFGVLVAIGIVFYWYLVFWVGDSPVDRHEPEREPPAAPAVAPPATPAPEPIPAARLVQEGIARTAAGLLARGMRWDASYAGIAYPGGDVSLDRGTGADLLVRSLRGVNIDLQVLIREDRLAHPERYPLHRWKDAPADSNIDHRRIANQWAFLKHYARRLDASVNTAALSGFQPGDIVFWGDETSETPNNVGIISTHRDASGMPYAIAIRREEGSLSGRVPLNHRPLMAHFRLDVTRLP